MSLKITSSVALAAALVVFVSSPDAAAIQLYESEDGDVSFGFSGYAQPYFRWVDNPCNWQRTGDDLTCSEVMVPDGFGLTRARIGFEGDYARRGSFKLELRTIPNVELLEMQLGFRPIDAIEINVGRFKVPFSRQELNSESRLQLIDRADFVTSATPGRQLGLMITGRTGFGLENDDLLTVSVGIFNGESAKERAPVNNIDEEFLYAARVEVAPFGQPAVRQEGDLRPAEERSQLLAVVGGSWTFETRGPDNGNYLQRNIGADLFVLWHGVSLYGEVFRYDRDYEDDDLNADRFGSGYNIQAGFFVPAPYVRERLEIAGRVTRWNPETARSADRAAELIATSGGSGPANSSGLQARRDYVAGLSWYFFEHDLKLQVNYTHREQIEDYQRSLPVEEGGIGAPRHVNDDSIVAQLTMRF